MSGLGTCPDAARTHTLVRREDAFEKFIDLVSSEFSKSFATDAFLASLGTSLGITGLIFLGWCLLRPYHSRVYAPKLRYALHAGKNAPPPVGKGYFSWLTPLMKCHEEELLEKIGMDATIFLRFVRMCRTLFLLLSVLGCCIMIPVNVTCNLKQEKAGVYEVAKQWYWLVSPNNMFGDCAYAHMVMAYTFSFIVMYYLWKNYKEITVLRRRYFDSPEYMNSLHARSLMIWDVPTTYRSDAGLNKLVGGLKVAFKGDEKCAIGRNVKDLPKLIKRQKKMVYSLEKVLAKFFKDPNNLPPRPMCRPDKDDATMDRNIKVDAIQYHRRRIEEIEGHILALRDGIDQRDSMQYGFVSYPTVSRAHTAAEAARGQHPKGTTIRLAARPRDIIWENLSRKQSLRRWNGFIGNLLFFALSVLFVVPNALIAVFLSSMNNIALVWPSFQPVLAANNQLFAIIQGFAAPTITSILYLILPIIMRRISMWQGDITRSSRERHVTGKLYFFFVLNNLVIFTALGQIIFLVKDLKWKIEGADGANNTNGDFWASLATVPIAERMLQAVISISGFWITYLLQRNMGAMLDVAQVVPLIVKSFSLHFRNPTPRQLIEWSAPPYFDYASYYNYFLFYSTVALCFSTIQPLVLPVAAFYFTVDSFLKKYTIMYVFMTKVESGGAFWRVIFNRMLVALILFNAVVCLLIWVRLTKERAALQAPILLILLAFKIYCARTFDGPSRFHLRGSDRESVIAAQGFKRKDNVGLKFSHPAIHSKLIKPMVPGKAPKHLVDSVLYGSGGSRDKSLNFGEMEGGISMNTLPVPGSTQKSDYELVREEDMDFANFQHRAEFGDHEYAASDAGTSIRTATPPPPSLHPGGAHSRPAPSPLSLGGSQYAPVPVQSPGPRMTSFNFTTHDNASETGLRLLSEPQPPATGGHSYHQPQYTQYHGQEGGQQAQYTQFEGQEAGSEGYRPAQHGWQGGEWQQQQSQGEGGAGLPYQSYEEYRGVRR